VEVLLNLLLLLRQIVRAVLLFKVVLVAALAE
jgi:hypothetical protein